MTFRNLTNDNDWTFGAGKNNYVTGGQEIALNLKTRVLSFLGDCFFATNEGIDWWNLLDYNKQSQLENAVQAVIIDTPGVTGINSIDAVLNSERKIIISYDIQTIYSNSFSDEIVPLASAV